MKTALWTDPIVAETRKWREELLSEADNDLSCLVQRLMESQMRHGRNLVCLEPVSAKQETDGICVHNRDL